MAKIKEVVEFSVKKVSDKVWDISTVYGGYFRHRTYMGYTKKQAIAQFEEDLSEEKI